MNKPKVYLAGPIAGLTYYEANDWRSEAIDMLDHFSIQGVSPMRAKKYLSGGGATLSRGIGDEYKKWPLSTNRGIVTRDRMDTHTADLAFMYLLGAQTVSIGSMIKVGWLDANRVPIVLIMEKDPGLNPHDHGMLREIVNFWVEDLEAAVEVAVGLLTY